MNITILVATHKAYTFADKALYTPIHVGKSLSDKALDIIGDDTGNTISDKNASFCELTALYWAWKNDFFKDTNYVGLVHYRRYFKGDTPFLTHSILEEGAILEYLSTYDIILPKKRNYYIESVESHYANAHFRSDLEALKLIVEENSPEYKSSLAYVLEHKTLYLYNMFIMKKELFDAYCTWLFPLLFALEKQIDTTTYDTYQKRVFGFLAERLFNVWIVHHHLHVKEIAVVNLEGENLLLKAYNMLKRKFL